MKVSRRVSLGPVALNLRFERKVPLRRTPRNLGAAGLPLAGDALLARPEVRGSGSREGHPGTALIVGAGVGFGETLARRLAREGMNVALASRDGVRLERLAAELRHSANVQARGFVCDATSEPSVEAMLTSVRHSYGCPRLVVYALQSFGPGATVDIEVPAFEEGWRHNCLGAFLVARAAARQMVPEGTGTIVLVGSTSSLIGRENHLNLAVGKFGQRALAQVMARELWPKGIHVVHLVIDADIREGGVEPHPQAEPEDLADAVCFLHRQAKSSWTSELDLRPSNERFWEHC